MSAVVSTFRKDRSAFVFRRTCAIVFIYLTRNTIGRNVRSHLACCQALKCLHSLLSSFRVAVSGAPIFCPSINIGAILKLLPPFCVCPVTPPPPPSPYGHRRSLNARIVSLSTVCFRLCCITMTVASGTAVSLVFS